MRLSTTERRTGGPKALAIRAALPFCALLCILIFIALLFPLATGRSQYVDAGVWCAPGGEGGVSPGQDSNVHWSPALILSITLGFGNLPISIARVIDIGWDLVIGRGGQVLLGLLSYRILRRSLLRRMEGEPIRFSVYTSLAFRQISLSALWAVLHDIGLGSSKKEISLRRRLRLDWRFYGHVLVLTYILAFPTLISVSAGYQANYTARVKFGDGLSVPASNVTVPDMVVIDGNRVGLRPYQPLNASNTSFDSVLACTFSGASVD